MTNTTSLTGKIALVTGSSRGIGHGIALELAHRGATVAIHYYTNKTRAEATLADVLALGGDALLVQADVTRTADIDRMFDTIQSAYGRLDIFVSNARGELGTFYQAPMDITLQAFESAMNSQARAFITSVHHAVRLMPDGGRIVAITFAPGGRTGSWQSWIGMGAAKAAMEASLRYFAVALAKRGITVNAISPGLTEDSVLNSLPPEAQQLARDWHARGWTPMGRLGTPADVGRTVAMLCSADASWITGQVIHADGGASLMDTVLPLEMQMPQPAAVG